MAFNSGLSGSQSDSIVLSRSLYDDVIDDLRLLQLPGLEGRLVDRVIRKLEGSSYIDSFDRATDGSQESSRKDTPPIVSYRTQLNNLGMKRGVPIPVDVYSRDGRYHVVIAGKDFGPYSTARKSEAVELACKTFLDGYI